MTKNVMSPKLTAGQRSHIDLVVEKLGLEGLRIGYIENPAAYEFVQDRRVVHVPKNLIDQNRWSDIRHLFRAILGHGPAVWNHGAENDWGPKNDAYKLKYPARSKT